MPTPTTTHDLSNGLAMRFRGVFSGLLLGFRAIFGGVYKGSFRIDFIGFWKLFFFFFLFFGYFNEVLSFFCADFLVFWLGFCVIVMGFFLSFLVGLMCDCSGVLSSIFWITMVKELSEMVRGRGRILGEMV